jgi:nucleoside phosphorylase
MTSDRPFDPPSAARGSRDLGAARLPFPDISGRWKMVISWQRPRDEKMRDTEGTANAEAVIKQSDGKITMEVFSSGSDSRTILAQPDTGANGSPVLHYMYEVEPKSVGSDAGSLYRGAAILRYDEYSGELSGNYWTSQFSKGHFKLVKERSTTPKSSAEYQTVDAVLVTALVEEFDAAKAAFSENSQQDGGVRAWRDVLTDFSAPYIAGTFYVNERPLFDVALARPTRMGSISTGNIATLLVERLKPKCVVMSGVCAGNPGDLELGDIVVSELAYQYDEGKRDTAGFSPDHRQARISVHWLHAAQTLRPNTLPSYGKPSPYDQKQWLLQKIFKDIDPVSHPARGRYFAEGEWSETLEQLMQDGLVELDGGKVRLTEDGVRSVKRSLVMDVDPPSTLPILIKTGPIASGNGVVKDGVTWNSLKVMGQRSVLGIEMEAATIGEIARQAGIEWIVIKGVMDHADPNKQDRYKSFAARASAEALRLFLMTRFEAAMGAASEG